MLYLDEINFTKRSFLGRDWSAKKTNLAVDQKQIYTGYTSVIASMSAESGIELLVILSEAIDAEDFEDYLTELAT